jgi:hypothetical protein
MFTGYRDRHGDSCHGLASDAGVTARGGGVTQAELSQVSCRRPGAGARRMGAAAP